MKNIKTLSNNIIENKTINDYFWYCLLLASSFLLTYLFLDLKHMDINIPLYYMPSGDTLLASYIIRSIEDFGWYTTNTNVGAPLGGNFFDFPAHTDFFHLVCYKLISIFTTNFGQTINIFYILLFPITAIISYCVMKKYGISNCVAIIASLSFTFLPYRFIRNQAHLFLSAYYMIPLVLMLCIEFYDNYTFFSWKKDKIFFIKTIIILIILSLTGVYYAFFTCFFFTIIAFIKIFETHKIKEVLIKYLVSIFSIIIPLICTFIPSIIFNMQKGANPLQPTRNPIEAEIYGMKITQLFIPNNTHNISLLESLHNIYRNAPLPNEGSEYLGMLGMFGFILLIMFLFVKKNKLSTNTLEIVSKLNIGAVLLATIGGFGSLFALIISPQIRAYNRISVYIAYFSIFAISLVISNVSAKIKNRKYYYISISIFSLIALLGIKEQVINSNVYYDYSKNLYNSDKNFIKTIEEQLETSSMIFQLPYFPFPENPPKGNMGDYALIRPYLHSKDIKWSYGGYKGREADRWNKYITSMSIENMVKTLVLTGFGGLYIDRTAYDVAYISALELKLIELLQSKPIVSKDNTLVFYAFENYTNAKVKPNMETEFLFKSIIPRIDSGSYGLEGTELGSWQWCQKSGTLNVENISNQTCSVQIAIDVNTGHNTFSNLIFKSDVNQQDFLINNENKTIILELKALPGNNYITFSTDAEKVYAPGDSRDLYINMSNIKVSSEPNITLEEQNQENIDDLFL